jgi:hypothetical protein
MPYCSVQQAAHAASSVVGGKNSGGATPFAFLYFHEIVEGNLGFFPSDVHNQ